MAEWRPLSDIYHREWSLYEDDKPTGCKILVYQGWEKDQIYLYTLDVHKMVYSYAPSTVKTLDEVKAWVLAMWRIG